MRTTVHFHLNQREAADRLVMQWHYSHRVPSNVQLVGTWHLDGGLFGDSGEAVAACYFSLPPTRWAETVVELTRLVRCEGVELPPLSGLIAETVRWCKRKAVADLLVSFADWTQTHHGGIYQACSWHYAGCRERRMDGVIENGVFVPGRTANGIWGTRSPTKLAARGVTVEPHYDEGKHLYWKALTKSGKAKAARLGLEALPYPKPSMAARCGTHDA